MNSRVWPVVELYVEDSNRSGSLNMAIDEYLLEAAQERDVCAVRIYGWDEATVSLGYFQKSDELNDHGRFAGLPVVRRLSGGGAILHHLEVTYSCVLPAGHPLANMASELYPVIHHAIIDVLDSAGVNASLRGDIESPQDEPFLCFSRGDRNDIMLNGTKIVGSAQRRRRGVVLQHGSIILGQSPFAEEIPGIGDLVADWNAPESLRSTLGRAIACCLAESIEPAELDASTERIRQLQATRYSSLDAPRR